MIGAGGAGNAKNEQARRNFFFGTRVIIPGTQSTTYGFRAGLFGIQSPEGHLELPQQTWAPNHPHMVFEQVSPIFLVC